MSARLLARRPSDTSEINWIVSRNVARAMRLRAINFKNTARISGISSMTLWRVLHGEGQIGLEVIQKIASALDIPMRAMVSEDFTDGHGLSNRALYCARLADECDPRDVQAVINVLQNNQAPKAPNGTE